jgi:hypothetical protein
VVSIFSFSLFFPGENLLNVYLKKSLYIYKIIIIITGEIFAKKRTPGPLQRGHLPASPSTGHEPTAGRSRNTPAHEA